MYRYSVVEQHLWMADVGPYTTYGILAEDLSKEKNRVIFCLSDVSTEKEAVLALAQRCTEEQLDPLHLEDVVADFFV